MTEQEYMEGLYGHLLDRVEDVKEEEVYYKCELDGEEYPRSEMVKDKDGCVWVAKKNVDKYLEHLKDSITKEEFETLKKQLK